MKNLFAVALYAVRQEVEGGQTIFNVHVESDSAFGEEEDVRKMGISLIHTKCKSAAGWKDHRVFLTQIPYEDIARAYQGYLQ